jgi:hypothetical protein
MPADMSAYEKTVAWDANDEPDLEGYILYSSVGNPCPPYNYIDTYPEEELANPLRPMARVTNLEYNTTYYFVLTAYDTNGYESYYSNIIYVYNGQWGDASCSSLNTGFNGGGGGGGGGCFIAAATSRSREVKGNSMIIPLLTLGLLSIAILKRSVSKQSISKTQ